MDHPSSLWATHDQQRCVNAISGLSKVHLLVPSSCSSLLDAEGQILRVLGQTVQYSHMKKVPGLEGKQCSFLSKSKYQLSLERAVVQLLLVLRTGVLVVSEQTSLGPQLDRFSIWCVCIGFQFQCTQHLFHVLQSLFSLLCFFPLFPSILCKDKFGNQKIKQILICNFKK